MSENGAAAAVATVSTATTPVIELREIDVYYGRVNALSKVSMVVNHGEIVALIGSNGAGKTTTLRTISGLITPRQGDVLLFGKSIKGVGAAQIAKLDHRHRAARLRGCGRDRVLGHADRVSCVAPVPR